MAWKKLFLQLLVLFPYFYNNNNNDNNNKKKNIWILKGFVIPHYAFIMPIIIIIKITYH